MREKLFGFQEDALSDLHKRINSANSMLPVSYTHLTLYNGHFFSVCPPVRENFNKKCALGFSGNESALEIRV